MVTIFIHRTKEELDVLNGAVTYTRQVSDLGDFSFVNASYSWSLKIKKTKKNVNIFEGLGVVGSQSRIPYENIDIDLLSDGATIVRNGKLIVDETTEDEYKIHIKDGAVSFYEQVKDDDFSSLNFSEINHINSVNNIDNSFDENHKDYKYLLAWYGLPLLSDMQGTTNLPSNGILPFVRIKKIIEAIENKYGWEFVGLPNHILDKYISSSSYNPDELNYKIADYDILSLENPEPNQNDWEQVNLNINFEDLNYINYNSGEIIVTNTGTYNFELLANMKYRRINPISFAQNLLTRLTVNGVTIVEQSGVSAANASVDLHPGDVIELEVLMPDEGDLSVFEFFSDDGHLIISLAQTGMIDFSELFKKLKVRDFIKEILIRTSCTPFFDVEKKQILFKTIKQRVEAGSQDLSEYFVRRVSERYVYQNFAKINYLKMKYSNDYDDYSDAKIIIDNDNLEIEKTLYESISYAKEENNVLFKHQGSKYQVPYLKSFELENSEGNTPKYKPEKDRFFIVDYENSNKRVAILGNLLNRTAPIAIPISFKDELKNWEGSEKIFQDSKIYKFELRIPKVFFSQIDLKKTVYLWQEQAYFLINKLTLKDDKKVDAELIKINNYG